MTLENTWRRLQTLPPEKQQEVGDFVESFREKHRLAEEPRKVARKSITDGSFFGMWRDREEMKNSGGCVRKLREREWKS